MKSGIAAEAHGLRVDMKRFVELALAIALPFSWSCAGANDAASIEELKALAEKGDKEATHSLCYKFIYGVDVDKYYAAARRWCESAAATGNASSQILLAEIFYYGHGVAVDHKKAFELFHAAAVQGHPHAELMVATMYGRGQGVGSDPAQAEQWLRRSASTGYEPAKALLAEYEAAFAPK
jgi:TPR repeat protein